METKTPVDIVEEALALQTIRKEAAERLKQHSSGMGAEEYSTELQNADKAIAELMAELSQFGDAVKGAGGEQNEVQHIWNETLTRLDSLTPEQSRTTLKQLKEAMKKEYQALSDAQNGLPESLLKLLQKQMGELN
jgi:ABC-type transporter Mla subunit MlaD